jgi:hypothetical protein
MIIVDRMHGKKCCCARFLLFYIQIAEFGDEVMRYAPIVVCLCCVAGVFEDEGGCIADIGIREVDCAEEVGVLEC